MIVYLVRRVGQSLLAVMAMAVLVFLGVFFIGNPVDVLVSPEASQAQIAATVERLGLDRPLHEQFGIFVWNALHGDLGTSFVYGRPALDIILDRLPATMELAVVALALSVGIGIPLGVWAGLRPDGIAGTDRARHPDPVTGTLRRPDADRGARRGPHRPRHIRSRDRRRRRGPGQARSLAAAGQGPRFRGRHRGRRSPPGCR